MSITKTSGVEGVVSSFLETAIFFLFITPVYWLATSVLYILIAAITASAKLKLFEFPNEKARKLVADRADGLWDLLRYPVDWAASLPVWVWILQAGGFLLMITIYWTPRDKQADNAQVRGLVAFLLTAVLIGAVINHSAVSHVAKLFYGIFIE